MRSARASNRFLFYVDSLGRINCKRSLKDIIKHVYYFFSVKKITVRELQRLIGSSERTIVDCNAQIREVCSLAIKKEPKIFGSMLVTIQIDESYFSGRRKYGEGRLLQGDRSKSKTKKISVNSFGNESEWNSDVPEANEEEPNPTSSRNYGKRASGPWVGIRLNRFNIRFIEVKDRTAQTLTKVIKDYVAEGSVIVTDQWAGYNMLEREGYIHLSVNHCKNYVGPDTGYHTQGIERAWADAKSITKAARGYNHMLQYHLDEYSWRRSVGGRNENLHDSFCRAVKLVHNV